MKDKNTSTSVTVDNEIKAGPPHVCRADPNDTCGACHVAGMDDHLFDDGDERLYTKNDIRLADLTLLDLIDRYDTMQAKINGNDGRLSTGSSAQLDYDMERQEEVAKEIANRLGLGHRLERLTSDHTYRLQKIESRLRLGTYRYSGAYQFLGGYLQVAPLGAWYDELVFGLINPLRRGEPPHWVRWQPGAWIFRNLPHIKPGRWGFGVLGVEVGSREPDDPIGVWLKAHGLWPW